MGACVILVTWDTLDLLLTALTLGPRGSLGRRNKVLRTLRAASTASKQCLACKVISVDTTKDGRNSLTKMGTARLEKG